MDSFKQSACWSGCHSNYWYGWSSHTRGKMDSDGTSTDLQQSAHDWQKPAVLQVQKERHSTELLRDKLTALPYFTFIEIWTVNTEDFTLPEACPWNTDEPFVKQCKFAQGFSFNQHTVSCSTFHQSLAWAAWEEIRCVTCRWQRTMDLQVFSAFPLALKKCFLTAFSLLLPSLLLPLILLSLSRHILIKTKH